MSAVRIDSHSVVDVTIWVDGHDLTSTAMVRSVTVRLDAVSLPEVVVTLDPDVLDLVLDDARVTLDDSTAAQLRRLGWTPPEATL